MAGAERAEVEDRLAHDLEERPHALEVGGGAAAHEDELGGLGAPLGARHRRIDHGDADGSECAARGFGEPRLRRRGVDQQRAAAKAGEQAVAAVAAVNQGLHDLAVRHHGDDDVAARRQLGGAGGRVGAAAGTGELVRQRGGAARHGVEQSHGMAGGGEMARHRPAHHAEADEADGGPAGRGSHRGFTRASKSHAARQASGR